MRTQLQQLGLEAVDDLPSPYREDRHPVHTNNLMQSPSVAITSAPRMSGTPSTSMSPMQQRWASRGAWAPSMDTVDVQSSPSRGGVSSSPWDANPPTLGPAMSASRPLGMASGASTASSASANAMRLHPMPSGDLNVSFRFPSSTPTYVPATEEPVLSDPAQLGRESLRWGSSAMPLLPPLPPLSFGGLDPRRSDQGVSHRRIHSDTGAFQAGPRTPWSPPSGPASSRPAGGMTAGQDRSVQLAPNFSFPPRHAQESTGPALVPPATTAQSSHGTGSHAAITPRPLRSASAHRAPSHTRHASYQLSTELSPEFLMAGGGIVNLATLGLSHAWTDNVETMESNDRQPASRQQHHRSSSMSSTPWPIPTQDELMAGLPQAQAQLAALHRSRQQLGPAMHHRAASHGRSASMGSQSGLGASGGAQRRALFGSYLPQSSLPYLLLAGKLVVGVLRINQRNRSDAWVTTEVLGCDIFISGSKDRNRALEGDLVAVELLDPKEVWQTKRDKVDKKKRKEHSHGASSTTLMAPIASRRADKARDDIDVEGARLDLIDDEEESESAPPALAGHVVAIVERIPGQMFPGTLGLLRPSSAATKEKQQAERGGDDDESSTASPTRPKIVWFRPSDKRVPLIAIPADQAPNDFWSEAKQEEYSRCLFVACIKRWPITSLHPFGSLVDRLGPIHSLQAESQALLRTHCHNVTVPWTEAALRVAPPTSITSTERAARRAFEAVALMPSRGPCEAAYSVVWSDEACAWEVGIHTTDVVALCPPGSALDREVRQRAAAVSLVEEEYAMWPDSILACASMETQRETRTFSVVFTLRQGACVDVWVGRSLVQITQTVSSPAAWLASLSDQARACVDAFACTHREARLVRGALCLPPLAHLSFTLDAKNEPDDVYAVCDTSHAAMVLDEWRIQANTAVAHTLAVALPDTALLVQQALPSERAMAELTAAWASLCPARPLDTYSLADAWAYVRTQGTDAMQEVGAALLRKALPPPKLFCPTLVDMAKFLHVGTAEPIYTDYLHPLRRYSDVCIQRQLDAVCQHRVADLGEPAEMLAKAAQQCYSKNRAAWTAMRQSEHLFLCRYLQNDVARQLVPRRALVMTVSEASFDIIIPSLTVQKRMHLDCLPLEHVQYDASQSSLSLQWRRETHPLTWLAQSIDDAQCAALWETYKDQLPWPPASLHTHIQPLAELRVLVLSDMEKSPSILKVVMAA